MQVHFGLTALVAEWPRAVACVGTFDGVHLGHAEVIRTAVAEAAASDLPAILVTFDRHPAAQLFPDRKPPALATLEDDLEQFRRLGAAISVVLPFDEALSKMSATDFLNGILVEQLHAERLVVGHDFAMGHGREGDSAWLQLRFPTTVVPAFELGGKRVSSSAIRAAVSEGRVEDAAKLLGRPFVVSGVVVAGQRLGRTLGYPTANVARSIDQVLPADGVYSTRFYSDGLQHAAALSIGTRPAVNGVTRTIEAYLLDYPGHSLYGKDCRIEILHRLREERDFPTLDDLVSQIELDVDQVRALHSETTKAN